MYILIDCVFGQRICAKKTRTTFLMAPY